MSIPEAALTSPVVASDGINTVQRNGTTINTSEVVTMSEAKGEIFKEQIISTVPINKKQEYDRINSGEARQWFKEAFTFLASDLAEIRQNVNELNAFGNQCKENSVEINSLKICVSHLEMSNKNLEQQIMSMQLEQRINNLIVHGIPETGRNENTQGVDYTFFAETLDIQVKDLAISAYRLGKPPPMEPKAVTKPRKVLIKFTQTPDRDNVRKSKSKLKGS